MQLIAEVASLPVADRATALAWAYTVPDTAGRLFRSTSPGRNRSHDRSSAIRAKINRGGALISDTKRFLAGWDNELDLDGNIRRAVQENTLAKGSREQAQAVVRAIKPRYFTDPDVAKGLIRLARGSGRAGTLDRILYYLTARNDPLIAAAVVEYIQPRFAAGFAEVSTDDMWQQLREWIAEGRTHVRWNDETSRRVAHGILSTLRDFSVLSGSQRKHITPPYVPNEAFALLTYLIHMQACSGEKTVLHDDWKLFFLDRPAIERFLLQSHQLHYLHYAAAGNVIRIDFPARSFEDQVNVVVA